MDVDTPLVTFQNHAIACDAWHLRLIDQKKPGVVQRIQPDPAVSARPSRRHRPDAYLIGMTTIVFIGKGGHGHGAGTFDALHFQFVSNPGSCRRSTRRTTSGAPTTATTCSKAASPAAMQTWQ